MQVTERETECRDLHALAEAFARAKSEPGTKAGSLMSGFLKKWGLHATNSDSNTHDLQNGEDFQEVALWEKQLMAGADPNAKNTTGEVKHTCFYNPALEIKTDSLFFKC